jgi:CRP-like cAMP-binding protein
MDKETAIASVLRRLSFSTPLTEDDQRAMLMLPMKLERRGRNETILSTGDRPSTCSFVASGFLFRSKTVADGKRQIFAFHQPGDMPDLQSLFLNVIDHDLWTREESVLGFIPHEPLRDLLRSRPTVATALWRETLVDAARLREWICNIGQREGISRLAYLVLEAYFRWKALEPTTGTTFRFPVSQMLLGEAIGMSTVHVNRMMQELRHDGLLEFEHGEVTIMNEQKLRELADFDPLYLHLDQEP